jgi:cyanate permease
MVISQPWRQVWVLSLTETVSWGVLYYAFVALLVPMRDDLGWSEATLTAGYSLGILLSGLMAPLVGIWIDRHGPRWAMTGGSALAALLVLAWSRVDSPALYIAIWLGLGLAMSCTLYEPAFASLTQWFAGKRDRPLLAVTICGGFASTIFLPLTTWLVGYLGWRDAVAALAGIVIALSLLPHLLFLRNAPRQRLETDTENVNTATAGMTLRETMRIPAFWWMTAGFGLQWFAATSVAAFMIPYLTERGDGVEFAAAATGAIGAAQVMARIFTTIFGRRFSQVALAATMLAAQTLAVVVLLTWQSPVGVIIAVILLGGGRGAVTLIRPVLIGERFGYRAFGAISGMQSSVLVICGAIAPVSVGLAYGLTDSYTPIMWAMAALAALSAVAMSMGRIRQGSD